MTSTLFRPSTKVLRILCFLPPALAMVAVAVYGVDVLRWDEWMVWINFLDRLDSGSVSISSFIAQQNEQRLLFARVLGYLHMVLFDLNRFPEFFTNLALAGMAFAGLSLLYARTEASLGRKPSVLVYLALSAFSFSLLQWDGFTQGINNVLFVMALFLAWGLILLQGEKPHPLRYGLAMLIGVLASFNFANGLFYWFVLFPLIWTTKRSKRFKLLASGMWLAVAAVVWALYFTDYVKPPHHPALTDALFKPHMMVGYFLTYLGGPISSDKATLWPLATLIGALGLASWSLCLISLYRSKRNALRILAPWLALAAFGVLSGMSTSLGRAALGLTQALESRYVTFGGLFWISLIPVALTTWREDFTGLPGALKPLARPLPWFALFCTVIFCISTVLCLVILHKRHAYLNQARAELYTLQDDERLGKIFPDPAYLKTHLKPFFDKRLSVYRDIPRFTALKQDASPLSPLGSITMAATTPPFGAQDGGAVSGLLIQGDITPADNPPDWVLITDHGRELFVSDVVFPEKSPHQRFAVFIPASWFASPFGDIQAWAVDSRSGTATLLDGGGYMAIPEPWAPEPRVQHYFLSR